MTVIELIHELRRAGDDTDEVEFRVRGRVSTMQGIYGSYYGQYEIGIDVDNNAEVSGFDCKPGKVIVELDLGW